MAVFLLRKLFVGAILDYRALVEYNNATALLDSGHPVRNYNTGATLHCAVKGLLDDLLTLFIKCTCRFVQDDNLGRFDKSASNRDSLFLTAGKFAALKTAYFQKADVELVFRSLNSCLVDEAIEPLAVESLHSGSVGLKIDTEQLLSSRCSLTAFDRFAETKNSLKIEFALILVNASKNLLSDFLGDLLSVDLFDLHSAHKELLNLLNLRLELKSLHNL